jgi:hypothetical protein
MDVHSARKWIIISSLIVSTSTFVFFVISPALELLLFNQALRLLQIVFPVFIGYLASAAHFVFSTRPDEALEEGRESRIGRHSELASILIRWPIIIFGFIMAVAIGAFAYTNRSNATLGSGMSVDQLALTLSISLGLLSATTNVAVSYLFSVGEKV